MNWVQERERERDRDEGEKKGGRRRKCVCVCARDEGSDLTGNWKMRGNLGAVISRLSKDPYVTTTEVSFCLLSAQAFFKPAFHNDVNPGCFIGLYSDI